MATTDQIELLDTIQSGLHTTARLKATPPSLRVDWIDWDSGFRNSGLLVGDDIVAIDGIEVDLDAGQSSKVPLIGRPEEQAAWAKLLAKDGTGVTLTVRRRMIPGVGWEEKKIVGKLHRERTYLRNGTERILGLGGPVRLARDEFSDSWLAWYDSCIFDWERQLGGGIWNSTTDSRRLLASHMENEARVRYLVRHYSGQFAESTLADWEAVRILLAGRQYQLNAYDFAYREAEEALVAKVTAAALSAWDVFKLAHASEIISAPPPVKLSTGDHEQYAGKLLLLPPASPNSWMSDVGRIMVSWVENDGWIFTPLESATLTKMWQAQWRYRQSVDPDIANVFSLVGRILPMTKLVAPKDMEAVIGLEVEPVAALLGNEDKQIFVDMSSEQDGLVLFSGEELVKVKPSQLPPDSASPSEVIEALFAALYARDITTWFALFAEWQFLVDGKQLLYFPYDPYPDARRDRDWTESRRVVLDHSYALRVVWVDDPKIVETDPQLELPAFERVVVEIDHVGLFDGEYRTFNTIEVHRIWTLERRDGGPWRIISFQGI